MKKFNDFCEKYETSLWLLCASIWFFVEYFCNQGVNSLLWDGIFWIAFAVEEFIRKAMKKK